MLEIGAFEAKNTFGSLLDRAENGEKVLITRHGKPVAYIVPLASQIIVSKAEQEQAAAAMQRIRERSKQIKGKFDWDELKRDRDEGRP